MPYSGSGINPYWMTINYNGNANDGAQSEQIPVVVGELYQFTVEAAYQSTYASGMLITLTWYTSGNSVISSVTQNISGSMTGGQIYTLQTTPTDAPGTASYAILKITYNSSPNADNDLQIYYAGLTDGQNRAVNLNYAFSYTYWPWTAVTTAQLGWAFSPLISGDFDSLTIGGVIELMGGAPGVTSDIPELLDSNGVGPRFRILAPPSMNSTGFGYEPSYDLNAPQPTQDVVASMLLDGERPFGTRSSNRTMSLPIIIFGTMAGGMKQVLAAREFLMEICDQQTFEIKWTSADSGLPMIFDCFRALPSIPMYGFNYSAGGSATGQTVGKSNYPIGMITMTIQALPYGRSDIDGRQNIPFTSPLINAPVAASSVTVDNYASVNNVRVVGTSNTGSAATSFTVNVTSPTVAGDGILIAACCGNATAQTLAATDTQGNAYTVISSKSDASSPAVSGFILHSPNSKPLKPVSAAGTGDKITVTTTNSETLDIVIIAAPAITGVDTTANASGSSAAPTITTVAPTNSSNFSLALYMNNNTQSTLTTPAGWTKLAGLTNSAERIDAYWITYTGTIAQTALSSYTSSSPWVSFGISVDVTPGTVWVQDSQLTLSSANSIHYEPPRPMHSPWPAAVYSYTFASALNLSAMNALSVWFGQSYDTQWPSDPKFSNPVTLRWTLYDVNGVQLSFSDTYKNVPFGENYTTPKWTYISASIPQGNNVFNYSQVAAYAVRITNWSGSGTTGYVRMHAWLNGLTANPQSVATQASPRGAVYNLYGLPGTARAPISFSAQLPASQPIVKELTGGNSWIVPPGVNTVETECWAAGGAGATVSSYRALGAAGGGGGEYAAEPALAVTPGQSIPLSVGQGGTSAQLIPTTVQFVNPGLCHWTCPAGVTSVFAEAWGGGAAGGSGAAGGGGGSYASKTVTVVPGTIYYLWAARGGKADSGISSADVYARNGQHSWFGPAGSVNGSTGYIWAKGGTSPLTGSSASGLGGVAATGTIKVNGGSGGTSPGPGGGGGGAGASAGGQGGNGGDSPSSSSYGRFTGGGTGGIPKAGAVVNNLVAYANGTGTTLTSWSQYSTGSVLAGHTAIVTVSVPAAATVTITDSHSNVYTQLAAIQAPSSGDWLYVFSGAITTTVANTALTFTQSVSQAYTLGCFDAPGVIGIDAIVTATGTSNAPSITTGMQTAASDLGFVVFATSVANTTSTPAGWTSGPSLGTGPYVNAYWQPQIASGQVVTSAYAASDHWAGVAISFLTDTAGGTGGAGANYPGFPAMGSAPGGGGGGGYTGPQLASASNPSSAIVGSKQVNYLGANGANGMVQLTYAVGNTSPVNGGNTTFGSVATTGTVVTAHGGTSATTNSAAGASGGSGSSNSIHNSGGSGAVNTSGTNRSFIGCPAVSASSVITSLQSMTYTTASDTSGTASASVAQGVSIVLIESAAYVSDLTVVDSAGNSYTQQNAQASGAYAGGCSVYVFTAPIQNPIVSSSTTITVTSATAQQYGVLWSASPFMTAGPSYANLGSGQGNGTAVSAAFGDGDEISNQYELVVLVNDGTQTPNTPTYGSRLWYNAGSTASLTASTLTMTGYLGFNQGGGTDTGTTGDVFTTTLPGTGNWAAVCIPLIAMNQQAGIAAMDWRTSTTPGASTTWTNSSAIAANGMIAVVGMCGTGSSITAGPSAISDASGNAYTIQKTLPLSASGGVMWMATAPVTAGLAQGVTGSIAWGHASAAPNVWAKFFWIPNCTGLDAAAASWTAVTGSGTAVSGSYTPQQSNSMGFAFLGDFSTQSFSLPAAPWNAVDAGAQGGLDGNIYAAQIADEAALPLTSTLTTSNPWGLIEMAFAQPQFGGGGGAGGGPNQAGYPAVWAAGGVGYAGGSDGGAGATSPNNGGYGATYPGGGGGGAYSTSLPADFGGQGGNGLIRLTWEPPLKTFNTLIVHKPGDGAPQNLSPVCPIPMSDVPNNTEYTLPALVANTNAGFNSTYSVILSNFYWDIATVGQARQITVTINQYEYPGGPRSSVQASKSFTPATDITNGLVNMGEVTLPVKPYANFNDQAYFTISISDTDVNDRFQDVLFLDTMGETILINIPYGTPGYGQYVNFYLDEPSPSRDIGFIGATFQDRKHNVSVLDSTMISGGPLYITPGDNLLLAYTPDGSPNVSVTYSPRWYLDRTV